MDLINGLFELVGALLQILNILQILKDKQVKGISLLPNIFFCLWSSYNLIFYPLIGLWLSFIGAIFMFIINATWLILALHYRRK